jgi:hypothetical protein
MDRQARFEARCVRAAWRPTVFKFSPAVDTRQLQASSRCESRITCRSFDRQPCRVVAPFVSVRGLSEDEQTAHSDALSSLAERPRLRTPGGDEFDASGALQC